MPREKIELADRIEYLSILDENGEVDGELEPDIDKEMLLKLHRAMLLTRRFDSRMLSLQRQGRIGTFPPVTGQEAAHLGCAAHLRSSDWFVPSFRETAGEIWRGRPLEQFLLYSAGYNEGIEIPEDRNDLPICVPVGSQVLHGVGLAWAVKYRGKDDVVMTFFGDGATSEGDFHEGLNFAGVYQLPAIFVCQNNQWAISVPLSRQTRSKTLAQKAIAYGIPGIQVDGNDILAVYAASQEAVERARKESIPTFIECVTYRMSVHTTADDPKRYRTDDEVEGWKAKDPLTRFTKYLLNKEILTEEKVKKIEEEIKTEIQEAVERAEEKMKKLGDPMDMFEHAYEKLPPNTERQKQYLERLLAES